MCKAGKKLKKTQKKTQQSSKPTNKDKEEVYYYAQKQDSCFSDVVPSSGRSTEEFVSKP